LLGWVSEVGSDGSPAGRDENAVHPERRNRVQFSRFLLMFKLKRVTFCGPKTEALDGDGRDVCRGEKAVSIAEKPLHNGGARGGWPVGWPFQKEVDGLAGACIFHEPFITSG
jgi:hypothetical protein